ncbi:acyl-CoA dehydrogenase family protein [Microcella sp.]|uniref:acyl-CoA dehydrogenase family protein n=1 Tax=Microcella sp. TaxID=1913979 RepID=UPI002565C50E|nr:acyl-CoA dehydrogenase family protein [Microcella sp.]MBX9472361.1 acyl-CoA/acyl-ACP dehydrogenase [Microcella sp.]
MLLTTLLDDHLDAEAADVLGYWSDLLEEIGGPRLGPDETPEFLTMSQTLAVIRDQGWLDFALDGDTQSLLYFEAIKRLHRRDLPLPVPIVEIWSAMRLLRRLNTPQANEILESCVVGESIPVLAVASAFEPGDSGWVPFGADVTVILAIDSRDGLDFEAIRPGVGDRVPANDPDPTLAAVKVTGAGESLGGLDGPESDRFRAELLVAQSAAIAGQSQALLESTMAYVSAREQFGVPVGSFQALRHRSADLATDVYAAQQMSIHAADQLPTHGEPSALGHLAKAFVGSAGLRMGSEAIQLHGGMGFTWEGGVHFGFKRIQHHAMTGPTVGQCEEWLGRWAVDAPATLWAGGLDEAEGDAR